MNCCKYLTIFKWKKRELIKLWIITLSRSKLKYLENCPSVQTIKNVKYVWGMQECGQIL